ncbi:MAG: hypothetical protein IJE43_16530 [Alphaproteobacteria bacterium]|nr:hypothetical protein [Alphaproteobacteria bacterium]
MRSKNPYSYNSGEIALDEAKDLPKEFYDCFERWKERVREVHNSDKITWYSKTVSISFVYDGKEYRLIPEDFYPEEVVNKANKGELHSGYHHAVVESLQGEIEKDLMKIGASNIKKIGFLD